MCLNPDPEKRSSIKEIKNYIKYTFITPTLCNTSGDNSSNSQSAAITTAMNGITAKNRRSKSPENHLPLSKNRRRSLAEAEEILMEKQVDETEMSDSALIKMMIREVEDAELIKGIFDYNNSSIQDKL